MLGSFHLYPTASLLTELVQIFQGKYIIRASLQIEGVTRVTGMAASEILEDAEDRARERVITIFGEVPNTQPQSAAVEAAKPTISVVTGIDTSNTQSPSEQIEVLPLVRGTATDIRDRIAEPVAAIVELSESALPETDVVISTGVIETEAPVTEPIQVISPKLEEPVPITVIETEAPVTEPIQVISAKSEAAVPITNKHSAPTSDLGQLEQVAPTTTPSATKTKNATLLEVTSQPAIVFDSTPQENITPPINQVPPVTISPEPVFDSPLDLVTPQTELPLTAVAPPNNVTPFVPRNYNPSTEIGIPDASVTAQTTTKRTRKTTQPKDNSDDIAKIAVEMERLQWTIEQGRDYLFKTYGQKSRHTLSDDQLRDFRLYLESQPTPVDDPLAIDPIAGF